MFLANVPVAPKFEFGAILLPALLLIAGILLAALVLVLVKRWNQQTGGGDSAHDQLALFRDVYQHGEMSPEEYQRVHSLLAGKIRQESEVPQVAQPPAKPASTEPPPKESPPNAETPPAT